MVATRYWLLPALSVLGPGLLVMLADTDAGSLIISAQSGAVWGYSLLVQHLVLIPVLFIVQELTLRLGLSTGMGQGELIKKYFGNFWAWLSISTLVVCCIGALLTEFSGLSAVGQLFGVPPYQTMSLVVGFLVIVAWTGSYHSMERIAILLGLFELVFFWVALHLKPSGAEISASLSHIPWKDPSYLYFFAGNIGAVIMPWMIFFQQSAILDKGLDVRHLPHARWDTAIGAVITQVIMASVLIITAATVGKMNPNTPLNTIGEISSALTPILGEQVGRNLFALGMTGAALVATIVVSLTAAWCVGEVLGCRRSLEDHPKEAPLFYLMYTLILILSAVLVGSNALNLVKLSVSIEVMNALLLPIVLLFLFLLARRAPAEAYRLKGGYAVLVGVIFFVTAACGLLGGLWGLL